MDFLGTALMLLIHICRGADNFRDDDKADAKNWGQEAPKIQREGRDTDMFAQGHTGTLG